MFRDGWIILNQVPVHVCTWGCWIEDVIPGNSVLLCITGNPGVTDFYYQFLSTLQPLIDMPVWVLSHGGFEKPPYELEVPDIDSSPELYDLGGQIEQKRLFINKYIPPSKKIYLIGHSVGGKISVELLKDQEIASKVEQSHLLFPVLEHISDTPNGKIYTNFIQYIIPFFVFQAWILDQYLQGHNRTCMKVVRNGYWLFSIIPRTGQVCLLSLFHRLHSNWNCTKEYFLEGLIKLFTTHATKTALHLAIDEMDKIKDLDNEVFENHYSKIYCYYGQNDRWAPLFQYHHLMEKHPKIKGMILDKKFTHSFVLTTAKDMALLLGKTIKSKSENS